jgi:hypothetical protein
VVGECAIAVVTLAMVLAASSYLPAATQP